MFIKICVVIILISIIQQMLLVYGQILPTKKNYKPSKGSNHTTQSYYQPNVFGPDSYAFGYEINDKATGNIQFRDERRYVNGTIKGSYGYVSPDGSMSVTHYFADGELGYVSHSQNFQPGEEPAWQGKWPETAEIPDDKEKANLTSILLPVEPISEEHGIDLNPPALEKEFINPAILKVIKSQAPLVSDTKKKGSSIGLDSINKFIPSKFPIVPFELPSSDLKINLKDSLTKNHTQVLNKSSADKVSVPSNSINSQKLPNESLSSMETSTNTTLPRETSGKHGSNNNSLNNFPQAESLFTNKKSDWYHKVINKTRQEYLETLK